VQDWMTKLNTNFIPEDQFQEIMNHTIKLNEQDSDAFIESICDKNASHYE